ncbi:hypothetical protein [Actinomadura sp. WAC 06369]|uniref:hypothetical protein n=1 Tax=Actinomadura sp. WAC 06369 TaxID=2203193 RepID=UPI000F799822|nr:hypothetical protein [Actinomadura sp. WAC 06369]RSN66642.1 hypothetical protein DMH08_15795 [Actinomadura sp. WAC 06369]
MRGLLGIRTFQEFLGQRLLTGQLVMQSFAVILLTEVYHYSNPAAALATMPFALGYLGGSVLGGLVADRASSARAACRAPVRRGRHGRSAPPA